MSVTLDECAVRATVVARNANESRAEPGTGEIGSEERI